MRQSLISSIRGMADILPDSSRHWQNFEKIAMDCFLSYGYEEIRTPLVESLELFERQLGTTTDVVRKEMYTFVDSHNDSVLALRPEATVSTVRALMAAGAHRAGLVRVQYRGPMFRHERPQKGRYRQFHQMGVEALGSGHPLVDAEQIIMLSRLWQYLKIDKKLDLKINNLGNGDERAQHKQALIAYFERYEDDLDEASKQRLQTNPLRIFDSKVVTTQALLGDAPLLKTYLKEESQKHVDAVKNYLTDAGVGFIDDPMLVRGLDYYNHTVYEWVPKGDDRQQSTICGGGRYDSLAAMIGAVSTPGCGFALGCERVLALIDTTCDTTSPFWYLVISDQECDAYANSVAERCRDVGIAVCRHIGGGNLGKQLKKADSIRARFAIIIGLNEKNKQSITVKCLSDGQQYHLEGDTIMTELKRLQNNGK